MRLLSILPYAMILVGGYFITKVFFLSNASSAASQVSMKELNEQLEVIQTKKKVAAISVSEKINSVDTEKFPPLDETKKNFLEYVQKHDLIDLQSKYDELVSDGSEEGRMVSAFLMMHSIDCPQSPESDSMKRQFQEQFINNPDSASVLFQSTLARVELKDADIKSNVMDMMIKLASKSEQAKQVAKVSFVEEYKRYPDMAGRRTPITLILSIDRSESWYNEVKQAFDDQMPTESFETLTAELDLAPPQVPEE